MFIRKTRPTAGNKYFIRKANGGYSTCIQGSPTDSQCNVLSNCVGYACGAFNEECGLGYEKYNLNCNAENFIERAISKGLSVYKTPAVGDIICWQKGATLSGNDGAGHVAIVIEVIDSNTIRTAESGWGSSNPWYIVKRSNNNGKWGVGSGYSLRGFIRNPNYSPEPTPTPTPTPVEGWPKSHKVVKGDTLSGIAKTYYGSGDAKHYNFIANANGIANPNIIHVGQVLTIPEYKEVTPTPTPQPTPAPTPAPSSNLAVGDKVKIDIKSSGYSASADGTAAGGRRYKVANGWTRVIMRIHDGKPYPYQVGAGGVTTGFFKGEDLKKL